MRIDPMWSLAVIATLAPLLVGGWGAIATGVILMCLFEGVSWAYYAWLYRSRRARIQAVEPKSEPAEHWLAKYAREKGKPLKRQSNDD